MDSATITEQIMRLSESDFFGILGVAPSTPREEFNRAYKKRALRVHPDKNTHPQATEGESCCAIAWC